MELVAACDVIRHEPSWRKATLRNCWSFIIAWIELHQSLRTNPKVTRLATHLGVTRAHATGLLANLWLWAVDHAWDGKLQKYSDIEIAEAAWWTDNPQVFHRSLSETGWIDGDGTLHDWHEYGVRLLENARQRKRKWINKKRRAGSLSQSDDKRIFTERSEKIPITSQERLPYLPYRTVPKDLKDGTAKSLRAFMQHFTQTLKTKTGQEAEPRLVRQAYGRAVGYLKTYPEEQGALSAELDQTPAQMPQAWYVAFLFGQIEQRTHEKLMAITERVAK